MLLVEAVGESKVGQFDMAQLVDEDLVGFDVTAKGSAGQTLYRGQLTDV